MPTDISMVTNQYSSFFAALVGVFAIAQCFFGYKLLRVFIAVETFLIGIVVGGVVGHSLGLVTGLCVIIALICAVIFACVSFKIYLAGVFLTTAGIGCVLTYAAAVSLLQLKVASLIMGIVFGIVVGLIAVRFVRPVVIILTSIAGGLCGAALLLQSCNIHQEWASIVVGIVCAVFGMVFQFKRNASSHHITE